jgi:hypothetical protein
MKEYQKKCVVCGKIFTAHKSHAKCCSSTCRVYLSRNVNNATFIENCSTNNVNFIENCNVNNVNNATSIHVNSIDELVNKIKQEIREGKAINGNDIVQLNENEYFIRPDYMPEEIIYGNELLKKFGYIEKSEIDRVNEIKNKDNIDIHIFESLTMKGKIYYFLYMNDINHNRYLELYKESA